MTHPPLALRDVEVVLGGEPVLRGIDLTVEQGEFVTLLGSNGSGKSTLVRAAVGLVPSTGSIELFGQPLARFRAWRRVGYVPQRSAGVAGVPATVREVVSSGRLSLRPRLGLPRRSDREAVVTALESVGLAHRASSPVVELSGGQQQRVSIARALAGEPELLVMDEPTAGVDAQHTEDLADLLRQLTLEGMTVLLVAHELGPMLPLVDRAVVLDRGRVVHDGPVDDHVAGAHQEHQGDAHPHTADPERVRPLPEEGVW
jgi:zinc transport system ATP-binding protein